MFLFLICIFQPVQSQRKQVITSHHLNFNFPSCLACLDFYFLISLCWHKITEESMSVCCWLWICFCILYICILVCLMHIGGDSFNFCMHFMLHILSNFSIYYFIPFYVQVITDSIIIIITKDKLPFQKSRKLYKNLDNKYYNKNDEEDKDKISSAILSICHLRLLSVLLHTVHLYIASTANTAQLTILYSTHTCVVVTSHLLQLSRENEP